MSEFVHLHNHTHYSLLDAMSTPKTLIDAAVEDCQNAVALTDHGVMFGTIEFYNYAKKAGIKPIIGVEAYMANGSRFEKIAGKAETKKRNYFHLILLAKNMIGYKNLMKLTSLAHTEGFYYKPRIDKELLEKYHEGLIACSACEIGVVNAHLIKGNYEAAKNDAQYYHDLFGEDFYIELQNHNLLEDEIILKQAPKIAKELGIKIVASNDVHYIKKEHVYAHNVLLCIKDATAANTGQLDIYKLRYRTPELYFKTQEQMKELFADYPEAIANTIEIADKCNLELEKKIYMPEFPIPKDSKADTLEQYLEEITLDGLSKRFEKISKEIKQRIEYELGVIKKMGYAGYFLIVWDFVKAAKELGVRVGPGRGSAAGSLVAYALGITNVNPLKYNLLFERFLNPDRVSMPDIDIDFCDEKRDLVIDYVKQKYGENSVAMIITFGKLSSRAVINDVGRVLGVPLSIVREITSKIPVIRGKVKSVKESLELPELKWVKESSDPKIQELIKFSIMLEGNIRNASTHAAGVVIAPGEITDYVPLFSSPKSKSQGVDVATQYSMNDLEKAGLLKMDFLGLRTLSIIDHSLEMIERNYAEKIDIDKIDFNDEKTFKLISDGNTLGVFQFESGGMQDYLRKLKPKNLEELTAMNALYRPGPMDNIPEFIDRKHKKKEIKYLDPVMKKTLKNTYGIIVYQEQVIQLVCDIAGFTPGQADILRRAMGKKDKKIMDAQKSRFNEEAVKNGLNKKLASEIFELIYKFADYGFNKSHSLAYSYLAYQTAWLKANYPAEFLAANMTSELNSQDKIVALIDEAKKIGIKVLPPDINRSFAAFNAVDNTIFFGMAAIKNIGVPAVESIVRAREEKPFVSFFDFISRVDVRLINKRALEALVCSGAFDSLNCGHRAALYQSIESALDYAKAVQKDLHSQMESLFGEGAVDLVEPAVPNIPEWSDRQRLEKEKEVLNFYVSGHPLFRYYPHVTSLSTLSLGKANKQLIGEKVRVCGLICEIRTALDKKSNTIAFVQLEDYTGKAECIFWKNTYSEYSNTLKLDIPVLCEGKFELDNDAVKIIVEKLFHIDEAVKYYAKGYTITINSDNSFIEKLKIMHNNLCDKQFPSTTVIFKVKDKNVVYTASNVNIPLNNDVTFKLMELFGDRNVLFNLT